jgi:hypothetical protein
LSVTNKIVDPVSNTFLLNTVYKQRPSIGFILESPHKTQYAFELFHETYRFFEKTGRVEVCFFSPSWEAPVLVPPSAMYHMKDLMGYRGNIVACSIDGMMDALRIKTVTQLTWYIWNVQSLAGYNRDDLAPLLTSDRITKVVRDMDYAKFIELEIGSINQLHPEPCPYPDINTFCQIFLGRTYE